jgi:hypothetical protein
MGLFPLALLLLRFNRGRVPRTRSAPLSLIIFVLVLTPVVFAGNVAIDPSTAGCVAFLLPHPDFDSEIMIIMTLGPQVLRRLPRRRALRVLRDSASGTAPARGVLGVRPVPRAAPFLHQ